MKTVMDELLNEAEQAVRDQDFYRALMILIAIMRRKFEEK